MHPDHGWSNEQISAINYEAIGIWYWSLLQSWDETTGSWSAIVPHCQEWGQNLFERRVSGHQDVFACATNTGILASELFKGLEGTFFPTISQFCTMVWLTRNDKVEVPTSDKFISSQSSDTDCCSHFASAGRRRTCFKLDSDGVSVSAASLYNAKRHDVAASYALTSFTWVSTPFCPASLSNIKRTTTRERSFISFMWLWGLCHTKWLQF